MADRKLRVVVRNSKRLLLTLCNDLTTWPPPAACRYEMVQRKLREVALARGKTSSLDRAEHVEMLTYLASVAKGPVQVSR